MKTSDLVIIGVVGYIAYKQGWLSSILPNVGPSPSGGLTAEQACTTARTRLATLDASWAGRTCDQVKAEVCGNKTLFVGTTGEDVAIRKAFGCPL